MILRYFSVEQGLHVLGTFDIHVDCVSGRKKSLPDLHAEDPVLIDPKREVVLWVGGRIRGDIPLQIYIHPRCSGGIVDLIGTVFRKSHSCQRQAQRHSQNDADCSFHLLSSKSAIRRNDPCPNPLPDLRRIGPTVQVRQRAADRLPCLSSSCSEPVRASSLLNDHFCYDIFSASCQ